MREVVLTWEMAKINFASQVDWLTRWYRFDNQRMVKITLDGWTIKKIEPVK